MQSTDNNLESNNDWVLGIAILRGACERVETRISPLFENEFFQTNLPQVLSGVTKVSETLKSLEGRVALSKTNATITLVVVNVFAPLGFIWLLVDASNIYRECGKFPTAPVVLYAINLLALLIFNVFATNTSKTTTALSTVEKIIVPKDLSSAFKALSHTLKRIAKDERKIAKLKERILRYKEICSKGPSTEQGNSSTSSETTSSATTTSSSDADDEEENDDLESGKIPKNFRPRINYGEVQYVLISGDEV